jgi:orotidine-5'-phosphate decarboxylase
MENFEKIKANIFSVTEKDNNFMKHLKIAKRLKRPKSFEFEILENSETRKYKVKRLGLGELDTNYGLFLEYKFEVNDKWQEYTAIVKCKGFDHESLSPIFGNSTQLVVRTDSGCETGQLFGDRTCDCNGQLQESLKELGNLNQEKFGIVVHIPNQDGRGMGLPHKLSTLYLQNHTKVDTVQSGVLLTDIAEIDIRTYSGVIAVIKALGINNAKNICLLTNNPRKTKVFIDNGFKIETNNIIIPNNEQISNHLKAKEKFLGHCYNGSQKIVALASDLNNLSTEGFKDKHKPDLFLKEKPEVVKQLFVNMKKSLACVGLDPDIEKVCDSSSKKTKEDQVFEFIKKIVDTTHLDICSFKIQKAFFDELENGHNLLKGIIEYIHKKCPNIPVILDCKIGDIDNTMRTYLRNIFKELKADGVVVNPYMGDDVFEELKKYSNKLVCVLIKTSNPGANIIQDIEYQNKPYWLYILKLAMTRWNEAGNIVPILASIDNTKWLVEAREMIPQDTPILFAGIGAQGGEISNLSYVLNKKSTGVFVNSSRSIIFAHQKDKETKQDAILRSAKALKNLLESQRKIRYNMFKPYFLILSGVSGAGKTTLIKQLQNIDLRFCYISPDITRPLRDGENDKNYIKLDELRKKNIRGDYLAVNQINNNYYATPKKQIKDVLKCGKFPILDFPIDRIEVISDFVAGRIFNVYLLPPSEEVLKKRLHLDKRDIKGERFKNACKELSKLDRGEFDDCIDLKMISEDDKLRTIAQTIYERFMLKVHGANMSKQEVFSSETKTIM